MKLLIALALQIFLAGTVSAALPPLPETPQRPVFDEYHGTKIVDPYQWLEKESEADVKKWTEQQAVYAEKYLENLPFRKEIKARLQEWADFKAPSYRGVVQRAGLFFAFKMQPPKNQPILVVIENLNDLKTERVILDPNTLSSSGTTVIDFFSPSHDGKLIAVSLSEGGSEIGNLSVYQVKDGKRLPDQIPNVRRPTAGGSVEWNSGNSGLYYTRYPAAGERAKDDLDFYQQIYFHRLGSGLKEDTYVLGKDFPCIAEIHLHGSHDGKWLLATVSNGDGGEYEFHLMNPEGKWTQVAKLSDKIKAGVFGNHGELLLVSVDNALRGKLLKMQLNEPDFKKAKVLIKESDAVIEEVLVTDNLLYVSYMNGGPTEIRIFNSDGKLQGKIPSAPESTANNLDQVKGDQILFRSSSYVQPSTFFTYEPAKDKPAKGKVQTTALVSQTPVSFDDIEVKRETVRSKDGTKVPVTLLYKKGLKKNKQNPTLLYGYGGYGISMVPGFRPALHLWLEKGGIFAIAHVRGGGEFGEAWHLQGNLTKKQNVFDDFIACAQYLVDARYTSKDKLAIEGRSNGGILMGAVMTQRPDLFRAVIASVGVFDMIRVERDPNGAFNVTEFGTVKDPTHFKALYAYSPYHNVKEKTNYPAVLLATGANDGRVLPYHSKKMAARLQAATQSGKPVLLRVTFNQGHGVDRSVAQRVNDETDQYAFLFNELGMKF